MIDSGSLHGKGGPAHAVEGAAHHGPTGTVYPGVGKRRVDEGGLVWGLWHQPPDGGQMAGALSGPRGGGVSGLGAAVAHAATPAGGGACPGGFAPPRRRCPVYFGNHVRLAQGLEQGLEVGAGAPRGPVGARVGASACPGRSSTAAGRWGTRAPVHGPARRRS